MKEIRAQENKTKEDVKYRQIFKIKFRIHENLFFCY